jgi:hypothetical protein
MFDFSTYGGMLMLWRHGDVLIAAVPSIPAGARRQPVLVLAHGELTGHSHRIAETETAELWEWEGVLYLRVVAEAARVVHQEHGPITLPRGEYRVWQQREYTPAAIRRVYD